MWQFWQAHLNSNWVPPLLPQSESDPTQHIITDFRPDHMLYARNFQKLDLICRDPLSDLDLDPVLYRGGQKKVAHIRLLQSYLAFRSESILSFQIKVDPNWGAFRKEACQASSQFEQDCGKTLFGVKNDYEKMHDHDWTQRICKLNSIGLFILYL